MSDVGSWGDSHVDQPWLTFALVTAAGIINTTPFLETTVAEFRQLFDINVIGSFLSVREGAKYMQRGARICMVASISSYTGGGYVARPVPGMGVDDDHLVTEADRGEAVRDAVFLVQRNDAGGEAVPHRSGSSMSSNRIHRR